MAIPNYMWDDTDPSRNPEGTTRYVLNGNFDINKQTVTPEEAFDFVSKYLPSNEPVGFINLPDKNIAILSKVNGSITYTSEIAILSSDNEYRVILRDSLPLGVNFNFSTQHLIKGTSKRKNNGDIVIYWVDGLNFDKYLNLTNPIVGIGANYQINSLNDYQLMSQFRVSSSNNVYFEELVSGGSLLTGVYYIGIRQVDRDGNSTDFFQLSNPISITDSGGRSFSNNYDGSLPDKPSPNGIKFSVFSDLNPSYPFIETIVVKKSNQVISAYKLPLVNYDGGTFTYSILNLNNATTIATDSLINQSGYINSYTITQLDNVLYKARLKSNPEYNLQPYINNFKINYIYDTKNILSTNDNYRNPIVIFEDKSFMWDETYALYATVEMITESGVVESKAFHIPGREATTIDINGTTVNENDKLDDLPTINEFIETGDQSGTKKYWEGNQMWNVNPDAKVFHTIDTANNPNASTNMGYWENENETYSNDPKWLVVDENGTIVGDLRGQKVRHHKFPECKTDLGIYTDSDASLGAASNVNVLGIQLSNIHFPQSFNVKKIKLFYAKRTINNRTVLGQSMALSGATYSSQTNANLSIDYNVFNATGNIVLKNIDRSTSPGDIIDFAPVSHDLTGGSGGRYGSHVYKDQISYVPFTLQSQNRGYIRLKPFDLLQQNTSVASATHVKNYYRLKGKYTTFNLTVPNTAPDNNFTLKAYFDLSTDFAGIDKRSIGYENINKLRKVVAADFIANNSGNPNFPVSSSPFNFAEYPNNPEGDRFILCQIDGMLQSDNTYASPYPDVAMWNCGSNVTIEADVNWAFASAAAPYLTNLCALRFDIFQSFDNQILCYTGKSFDYTGSTLTTYDIFGGDTFTSYYGERSTAGYGPNLIGDTDPTKRQFGGFSFLHYYICQSTSNINYRHEGDNSTDIYFPKTDRNSVLSVATFVDNWYGYNIDYSSVNDILQPLIETNTRSITQTTFDNRIIRSAVNNPETESDNYLIWEAGNEKDVGLNKGPITDINGYDNKLYIQTEQSLFYTVGRQILKTENSESFIGSGDIFQVEPMEMVTTNGVYGGTPSKFATAISQYGMMFADPLTGIIFNVSSKGLDEISKNGKELFFRQHLKFNLPTEINRLTYSYTADYSDAALYNIGAVVRYNDTLYISVTDNLIGINPSNTEAWNELDWKYSNTNSILDKQGIGVEMTFDYKYRRLILTKKDYSIYQESSFFNTYKGYYNVGAITPDNIYLYNGRFYFITTIVPGEEYDIIFEGTYGGNEIDFSEEMFDRSFTISYYPEKQGWGSYYSYLPKRLHSNYDKVLSYNEGLYEHNSESGFLMFYNQELYDFVIDYPKRFDNVNRLSSVLAKTVVYDRNLRTNGINYGTGALRYNKTFNKHLVYDSYQCSLEYSIINTQTARNSEGYWIFNQFRDYVLNNNLPYFDNSNTFGYLVPNSNVSGTKHWTKLKKFNDYWFISRFTYSNSFERPSATNFTRYVGNNRFILNEGTVNIGQIVKLSNGDIVKVTNLVIEGVQRYSVVEWIKGTPPTINTIFPFIEILNNDRLEVHDIDMLTFKTIR
jgi:hypothetical protein